MPFNSKNLTLPHNQWHSETELLQQQALKYHLAFLKAIPLTTALKKLAADFKVQLQQLGQSTLLPDEQTIIQAQTGYSREVYLCLQGIPVIWARSVCPLQAQQWQDNMNCGTQPLGSRLYQLPQSRSAFEFACLTVDHPCNPAQQAAMARRSCFWLNDTPLILTETFLPALAPFYQQAIIS